MPSPRIEDYAFLSDTRSAAMVSRSGSVDWLTFPRFDSPAAMAALVGTQENGHFSISPVGEFRTERRYLPGTLVLETTHTTPNGTAVVTDALAMPHHHRSTPRLLRKVEVTSGRVAMRMELRIRFGYGRIVPWVRRPDHHLLAIGGPDALVLRTSVDVHGEGLATVADFEVGEGTGAWFDLAWFESQNATPPPIAVNDSIDAAFDDTITRWREWSDGITYDRAWSEEVTASAVVLKGLTYSPTGAIVAAPTTSLPETPGGARNWDYRYCWLRDATFTLYAFVQAGLRAEATHWRDWLLRACAGDPDKLQIMYGLGGERWLPEFELDWLAGFGGARPVRVGNGAADQLQLDVFGEVMDSMYQSRVAGMPSDDFSDALLAALLEHLETIWQQADEGIWEVRGNRQHFTHSKVMSWVAFDRAAKSARRWGGDEGRWRQLADEVRREVCERAVDATGVFRQAYGSTALDASVLRIPLVGFLPPSDPRVLATVEAIERDLAVDGLLQRYNTDDTDDGLEGDEGAFLLCSFWLADCLDLVGRRDDAVALYERLLALRNDVGLLAEEYGTTFATQLGNCPQAFSHVAIINTATNLCDDTPSGSGTSRVRLAD